MINSHAPKTLYIPPNYGGAKSGLMALECDVGLERAISQTFRDNGFDVVVGAFEQERNPNAVGIHVDSLPYADLSKHHEYYKFLVDKAIRTGATMPHEFTWDKALTCEKPIVAKHRSSNRGDGKYLLTSYEEKMRFLVWALNGQSYFWVEGDTTDAKLEAAKKLCQRRERSLEVLAGITDEAKVSPRFFKGVEENVEIVSQDYQFQEYVKSPSGKNASYRVVVDAKGEIHYIALITSEFEREQYDMRNWGDHPWGALDRDLFGTLTTSIFLTHPNSPMHIPMYRIVSNRAQGGNAILLSSNSIDRPKYSEVERTLLEAHGLNPDKPQLPDEVLELSRRIAFEFRSRYPYGGLDYIQNPKGEFLFLEHNARPDMNPLALGLDAKMDPNEVTLEMMKRVAQKF